MYVPGTTGAVFVAEDPVINPRRQLVGFTLTANVANVALLSCEGGQRGEATRSFEVAHDFYEGRIVAHGYEKMCMICMRSFEAHTTHTILYVNVNTV